MNRPEEVARTLHALSPEDRMWVFNQLSESEREAIRNLVANFGASTSGGTSGFEAVLVREHVASTDPSSVIEKLQEIDSWRIAKILQHEPDWVVGIILRAHRWPWHHDVLRFMELGGNRATPCVIHGLPPTRAIDALLQALYEQACALDEHEHEHRTMAHSGGAGLFLTRLKHRLQGVLK